MPATQRQDADGAGDGDSAGPVDDAARVAHIDQMIRRAIEERLQVIATYDGHRRGLCPHLLGTTNGRRQALCYQFSGTSRSVDVVEPGLQGNWRCIPLAGLSEVSLRAGPWHTADNYNDAESQTCVELIAVAVADADANAAVKPGGS